MRANIRKNIQGPFFCCDKLTNKLLFSFIVALSFPFIWIPVTTKMVTICFTAAQISKKNTTKQLAKGMLYIPKGCEATYTVDKNCGMFSEIKEG